MPTLQRLQGLQGFTGGALALVFACETWLACTVTYETDNGLPSVGDASPEPAPSFDAAADGGLSDGDAGAVLFSVPERPSAEDVTNRELTLVFAMQWMSATAEPDRTSLTAEKRGYDLDGVYTCPQAASCRAGEDPAVPGPCDGLGGRDNALQATIDTFGTGGSFTGFNAETGKFTILLVVDGYNGGANDRQVTVRVYSSTGSQPSLPGGGADPEGGVVAPKFDGTDYWRVDESQLQNTPPIGTQCSQPSAPCASSYKHTAAYVVNHVLVTELDLPVPFPTFGPKARLDIRSGYITAELRETDGTWSMRDGQVTGRCTMESMTRLVGLFPNPFAAGKRYCQVPGDFAGAKQVLCGRRDILADRSKDGKDLPCDSMSVSFLFSATPSRLGTVSRQTSSFVDPCPADTDYKCAAFP